MGYPKYQVAFFLADTLFGSGVWLDLYHPCFISFLLFHTFQINVSKRIKTNFALNFKFNFQPCVNIYPPPIVISYRFLYFYLFFTPNPRINFIQNQILIMKENKELYDAPTLTAVELKQEGVICASPEPYNNPYGDEQSF